MKVCKICKGTDIKSRTNYSHGKRSSSTTMFICKKCGSTDIESSFQKNKRRNFRK